MRPLRRHATPVAVIALALIAAGCKTRNKASTTTTTAATAPQEHAADNLPLSRLADGPPPRLQAVVRFLPADGLRAPAAVIHDEASDSYLVSNMDGPPLAVDGKGFISRLSPDGTRMVVRWIASGKNNVVLNAPKGMALRGDELYVADIDTVRIFHRQSGLPLGEVKIPGAKYLDDVVIASDGEILVSDAGLKTNAAGDGLEESATDAIYAIYHDDKVTNISLVAKQSLAGPTGLYAAGDKIWSVTSRGAQLFSLDGHGKPENFERLPLGALEGIAGFGDELLVSSRAASAILRGRPKGPWRIAVGDVGSPGAIDVDRERRRVLVPLTAEDEVRVYELD